MKKNLLSAFLLITLLIVASCSQRCKQKPSGVIAPDLEITALKNWLDSKSITAIPHPSGFFYTIANEGVGNVPTLCNNVDVNYKAQLLNGSIVDSGKNVSLALGRLIIAWQKAIPLIKPGGSMVIYSTPTLAYGANGSGPIPANSSLIFSVDLLGIK